MESHEALACALFCVAGRALLIAMDSAGQCLTELHSHLGAAQREGDVISVPRATLQAAHDHPGLRVVLKGLPLGFLHGILDMPPSSIELLRVLPHETLALTIRHHPEGAASLALR